MPFIPVNTALEHSFPAWLQDSIKRFTDEYHKYQADVPNTASDCGILDFQSDINNAEMNSVISSDAAWHLRQTYLGMKKEEPSL